MKILVTGIAGFIGYHITKLLLQDPMNTVIGIDDFNSMVYDESFKYDRIRALNIFSEKEIQRFHNADITNPYIIEPLISQDSRCIIYKLNMSFNGDKLNAIMSKHLPDVIVHLAAYANPRISNAHSNSRAYIINNILSLPNVLDSVIKCTPSSHVIIASSSSVYSNVRSVYSATKRCDEILAQTYSDVFNLNVTAIRPFTVYGPFGRPDMAIYKFANAIQNDIPITLYNNGENYRDFTYVSDFVESLNLIIKNPPKSTFKIYDIGNSWPVRIADIIPILETFLHKKAKIILDPNPQQEAKFTKADISAFYHDYKYKPTTNIEDGIHLFIEWYLRSND